MLNWLKNLFAFRARSRQRRRQHVAELLAAGQKEKARSFLVNEVSRWAWNWEDGSRDSHRRDLDHLRWSVAEAEQLFANPAASALLAAIDAVDSFIADRTNFRIDGRMMTRKNANRNIALNRELESARASWLGAAAP